MRLSTTQLFVPLVCVPPDWSKLSVVCRPTFIVCHVRMASEPVCFTFTLTVPFAFTVCVGRFALYQSVGLLFTSALTPGATCKPPETSPLGTFDVAPAPAAAACCAAIC